MGLLQKLVVLRCSGTVTEIGGAEVQWNVTEIGGAEVQWDCYRNWWC